MTRDRRRVIRFVELAILEADREGAHLRGALFLHQRDDQRRIDAAGQERSERHVRNLALAHRGREQRFQRRLGVSIGQIRVPAD